MNGNWVRVTNAPKVASRVMENCLKEQFHIRAHDIQRIENGFRVSLRNASDQTKLLKMHGSRMDSNVLKITRHQPRLSAEEIFNFISTRLRTTENALDVKSTVTPVVDTRPKQYQQPVRAVEIAESPMHMDESEGESEKCPIFKEKSDTGRSESQAFPPAYTTTISQLWSQS